jgi:hypothetical protein
MIINALVHQRSDGTSMLIQNERCKDDDDDALSWASN